jgi:hypothetical protein
MDQILSGLAGVIPFVVDLAFPSEFMQRVLEES